MGSSAQKLLRFYPLHEDSESTSPVAATATPRSSFVKVYVILLTSLTIFLLGLIVILVLVVIGKRAPSVSSPPARPSSAGPSSSSTTRGLTTKPISTSTRKVTTAFTAVPPSSESNRSKCRLPLVPQYGRKKIIVAGGDRPGSGLNELNKPRALALDSAGNLYVADSENQRVMRYRPNSTTGEIVVGNGTGRYPKIDQPISRILIDKNDLLYTYVPSSAGGGRLIVWPSTSENGTWHPALISECKGLAIDSTLNPWAASNGLNIDAYVGAEHKQKLSRHLFGEADPEGVLPVGSSNIYIDADDNQHAIDILKRRVERIAPFQKNSERVLIQTPILSAITGDCHKNLYTIDSNATLYIYNFNRELVRRISGILDNPRDSAAGKEAYAKLESGVEMPDFFSSLVLDPRNGDLYVIMFGYDRVTKFPLS